MSFVASATAAIEGSVGVALVGGTDDAGVVTGVVGGGSAELPPQPDAAASTIAPVAHAIHPSR
jgi:hypothetical protein